MMAAYVDNRSMSTYVNTTGMAPYVDTLRSTPRRLDGSGGERGRLGVVRYLFSASAPCATNQRWGCRVTAAIRS
jgi:hypothetical protein